MKVAVLKGGRSLERVVSLRSGARVEEALARLGHEVVSIDAGAELVEDLAGHAPEVAFVAMHGPGGEDGTVQELLEILGIPFTGPGVAACIRCIDKALAKHELRAAGVPTPDWLAFNETAFRELGAAKALGGLEARLGFPLVVKPSRGGSALGVKFAAGPEEVPAALVSAFSYDDRVLLERFVDGRELAVSILGDEPLPIVEAIPTAGDRYDFEARYEIGRTSFICPAELTDAEEEAVNETLEQDPVVVAEGRDQRLGDLARRAREADPERGAAAARLHHQREAERLLQPAERVGGAELAEGGLVEGEPLGGGEAGELDRVLALHLVHAARAGRGARTGEGDAEDLQQLLHGSVLAADAVHRDEGHVGPLGAQALDQVGADVDRQHLVAEPLQRVLDPRPGAQRDAALQRAAAFQHRDLHPASPALRNGSTFGVDSSRGSGSFCSPVRAP